MVKLKGTAGKSLNNYSRNTITQLGGLLPFEIKIQALFMVLIFTKKEII
jgi:hypothetical protein